MTNDVIQHISNYIMPGGLLATVFGCGILYQKFRALSIKAVKLDMEFKKHCEQDSENKVEIAATTSEILTEIRGLKELYSQLRKDLREFTQATTGAFTFKGKK